MKNRTVVWKAVEYEGLEYFGLHEDDFGVQVASCIIGVEDENAFLFDYVVNCNTNYCVTSVIIGDSGKAHLDLSSDGKGNWVDRDGNPMPQFAGCIDIDITATPFTNTLPIRRVTWEVGQTRDFNMLYVTPPELTLSVSEQRYTCLEKSESGGLFRFELRDGSFSADLPVDADGLVLDYLGLFKRLWAS